MDFVDCCISTKYFTGNAFKLLVIKQRDIAIRLHESSSSFNSVNIKYKIVEVQNHITTNVPRHINANAKIVNANANANASFVTV